MKKENYKVAKGKTKSHKERILEFFKQNPDIEFTNKDIREFLGFQKDEQVAKRTSELYDSGLISVVGHQKINDLLNCSYQLTPLDKVNEMREKVYRIKKQEWIEEGIRKGYIYASQFKLKD